MPDMEFVAVITLVNMEDLILFVARDERAERDGFVSRGEADLTLTFIIDLPLSPLTCAALSQCPSHFIQPPALV
jgi:hypothetical protein